MSHGEMTADQARRDLYEIMQRDLAFEEKAERVLELGEAYLGVQNGHLTRVDTGSDYWKAIVSTDPPDGQFPPGLKLDLESTYCRRTVEHGPITLHDAPNQGWADDPGYEAHELDVYFGTTLVVSGEPYGTVCFVSEEARSDPFSDEEVLFAELASRMLEHEIRHTRTQERVERLELFASTVSHDLRNPLQIAQGNVELERERRGDSNQLATAAQSLTRMQDLIGDVLALARQSHDVTETELVSLSDLGTECWHSIDADRSQLELAADCRFRADPRRCSQLLENVFRNALDHGGADVTVEVGPLAEADGFYVEDSGPGISADATEDIFESGYSTGGDGIGLGLAIVDGVVSAHDWTISVTEGSSGGARFEISDVIVEPA